MAIILRDLFDEVFEDLIVDQSLVNRLKRYKLGFISKNSTHASFFGNVLLGVDLVKHMPSDRAEFFEDVLGVDEETCKVAVMKSPLIESDYMRLSDPYNLCSIYIAYRIYRSKLPDVVKREGMHAVIYMLQVKLFTSILSNWYKRPAPIEEAKATYAAMTMKSSIKQVESYDQWFEERVDQLLSPDSIHINAFHNFTPDTSTRGGTLYAVTEPQDRLREVVKTIFEVHKQVRANGGRIGTASSTFTIDGEILIRSNTHLNKQYLNYIQSVMLDKQSFIRKEVLDVVTDAVSSVSETLLVQLLGWVSDSHAGRTKVPTYDLSEALVLHAINFIQTNKLTISKVDDFAILIVRLKDLYMAPRLKDVGLLKCREWAGEIATKSKVSKSGPQVQSLKNALQLYITVRALTMTYYK